MIPARLGGRAGDGGESASGPAYLVVAGHDGLQSLVLYEEAIAGAVHLGIVAAEDVADPPAGIDLVHLEAVLDAADPRVVLDSPVVSLDVHPAGSRRRDHSGAIEMVADDLAPGRALLDVDVLCGGTGNVVVLDDVAVTAVRLARGVPAPVTVGRAHVDALAVELHEQPGVLDNAVADRVVAAEIAQMEPLVTDGVHEQAVQEVVVRAVGHDSFLTALDAEALYSPPGRVVEVEGVAVRNAA